MKLLNFQKLFILVAALIATSAVWACTGIQLKAKDGHYVNGRTVEFGMPLDIAVVIIPRNYEFKGTLPDGSPGLAYRTKYAALGGSMFVATDIVDGVNEKGLSIGAFYFQNYAAYSTITPENKGLALSPTEFSNWILTQFATVDEVKKAINSVVIAPTTPKGWPVLPPFHYIVYDKSGNSLVIEPINGQLKVHNNPLGVITNSPTFDWHLTNLSNYINLSPINPPATTVDGYKLKQFGMGSGLHGLPGDFTPPSRFVRAAFFSILAVPADNVQQNVLQAFHILNQFDIPVGSVREVENNTIAFDRTLVTTVKDPANLKYYFKTYADQDIKVIDLNKFDLNDKAIKRISIDDTQSIVDISTKAK
ncbi:choloylglycine hydrolase family protein [soil metagenome]